MSNQICREKFTVSPASDRAPDQRSYSLDIEIPDDVSRIQIDLEFSSKMKTQLPVAVFDAGKVLRGIGIHEFSTGPVSQRLWLATDEAGKGAVPGPIHSGSWSILIYGRHIFEEIHGSIVVAVEYGASQSPKTFQKSTSDIPIIDSPGRYCGELHMHSAESTGRTDVETLAKVAAEKNLDFIGITDHFTISHWPEIDAIPADSPPLLIHSYEVSGERGHANLHGVSQWISPFVDLNDQTARTLGLENHDMNAVADAAHNQGGLFCINHPLSGKVAWRYNEFDWEKADLIEVVGLPDGPNSFLYPVLWDRLLCEGHRTTGIGSSDSHDPLSDGPWKLGMIRNWVQSDNLSEKAIITGLRSGNVAVTYGDTRLGFTARILSDEDLAIYEMGETISCSKSRIIEFKILLTNHPKGNFYIIKDGLIYDVLPVKKSDNPNESSVTTFTIEGSSINNGSDSYVRVEFHEEIVEPYYVNMAYRDHTSIRGLANPVFLTLND